MIRKIYQELFPHSLRTALGQCRNSVKQWWWKHHPVETVEWWWIRRRVSTSEAHRERQARLRALLEGGKPINVVFEVTGISKWKVDSVLRLMMGHPRFNPIVWHVPYTAGGKGTERDRRELEQCRVYFSTVGAKLVDYAALAEFPEGERPDVIFPDEPYDISIYAAKHNKGILNYLFCFLPYGYTSTVSPGSRNQIINNGALFAFFENELSKTLAAELMNNHGINTVVTGHPMADSFLFTEEGRPTARKDCGGRLKRVIWAPHWTIEKETCWLFYGTFMQTGEILLEMAEKYRGRIQFAFKPHPNLYYTLCKHPEWGKERTNAFYAKWREMPNTQFEDGAYADLFMQSDAMIHDCGSFIQEYLFADKPCMYLKDPANRQEYSAMAADCLNAYQIGITREEIEEFLQMVLRGEDPKAEVRRELRKKYLIPPHGQSAAQNIIDCLLMQEHHG